jgi:tetratricopeptide (TPR) repeat protein
MRGQNQYDALQDSGVSRNNARTFYLPPTAKTCQDCHMPMVKATRGDLAADADGMIRSHLFPGANTALPFIRGDHASLAAQEAMLKECATVDVFAVGREREIDGARIRELVEAPDLRDVPLAAGETVELQVVVRNRKVGHLFPAGTTDSNECWVEFTVFDPAAPERPLYESGRIDAETRKLDAEAHDYRTVFVDEHSQETRERDPQNFRAKVHQKLIGPGTADIARYRFVVPEALAGRRLGVRARLLYRKFNRYYTEFAYRTTMKGRPVPDLPVTEIHAQTVTFPVVSGSAGVPAAIDATAAKTAWTRWNDWCIGLLLQGDTRGATQAFETVRDALPDAPDGWRNLARVHLRDGDVDAAVTSLQEAEKLAPGNAQTAYFFGKAREQAADQLDEAIKAYERAREDFPEDRTIHRALGQIRYRLGRYEEALSDFLAVLRIDPEDREAHYGRFLIYSAQGNEKLAAVAEKAYLKYQIDESAQGWTNAYRREHANVNRESQSIHTHDLELLR